MVLSNVMEVTRVGFTGMNVLFSKLEKTDICTLFNWIFADLHSQFLTRISNCKLIEIIDINSCKFWLHSRFNNLIIELLFHYLDSQFQPADAKTQVIIKDKLINIWFIVSFSCVSLTTNCTWQWDLITSMINSCRLIKWESLQTLIMFVFRKKASNL